ncbi:MAG: DUF362 domain-containing protein [Actinomycetota bacterium]
MFKVDFNNYGKSVSELLDLLSWEKQLEKIEKIILKPNLLEDAPPPCTTDKDCLAAIIEYILNRKNNMDIVILEGSGGCDTQKAYAGLGYESMAKKYGVRLMDVDRCRLVKLSDEQALAYREIYLPEILLKDYYFISVPALKAHSITKVTLSYKNLIGLLPKKYYGGYLSYNRSDVHRVGVDKAIYDLSRYITIDLALIDGRVGQAGSHLRGGRRCDPPKDTVLASYDALQADTEGCRMLGIDPQTVRHLQLIGADNG